MIDKYTKSSDLQDDIFLPSLIFLLIYIYNFLIIIYQFNDFYDSTLET